MPPTKLYAGAKLRELRARLALTQRGFAAKLGISLPYLNQMENNHRPVSALVLLAQAFRWGFFSGEAGLRSIIVALLASAWALGGMAFMAILR